MNSYQILFSITLLSIIIYAVLKPNNNTNYQEKYENAIKTLIRQAARWTTASLQDENAMIAVLHANYGAGYLWALQDIADSQEIEKIGQINPQKFKNSIVLAQDSATKKMAQLCPKYAPPKSYLTQIAGEG